MSAVTETPPSAPTIDPVLAAIHSGDAQAVRAAGKEAASARDPDTGKMGLTLAANAGHAEVVAALLEAGAKDAASGAAGWTGAMSAAFRGHSETLEVLLKSGGKEVAMATDPTGATALMMAASRGHISCVGQLLDVAPDSVNGVDMQGRTALIWAVACNDNQEVIRLLVQRGANIDAPSMDGRTPLMWAVLAHQAASVEALAILGANPDLRDVDKSDRVIKPGHVVGVGQTALDHAGNVNTRDPVLRIICSYLTEWIERRKLDPTAPAHPMAEHPWITHAKESAKKAEEEAAEAALRAIEAPAEATGDGVVTDESDIFGSGDAIEDITDAKAAEVETSPTNATPKTASAGFELCASFQGARPGSVFKLGEHGLGYYADQGEAEAGEVVAAGLGDLDDLD